MDGGTPSHGQPHLSWTNVGFAFAFIALDAAISRTFRLELGSSLITAALRCIGQLVLIALILQKVFEADDPWAASAIGCKFVRGIFTGLFTKLHVTYSPIEFYGDRRGR